MYVRVSDICIESIEAEPLRCVGCVFELHGCIENIVIKVNHDGFHTSFFFKYGNSFISMIFAVYTPINGAIKMFSSSI